MTSCPKNVKVVVLGDIGRSPRMQYHSISLAEMGHTVDIIGYGDTEPNQRIKRTPSIYYHYMLPPPLIPLRLINYIFKTIWQALNLLFLLSITRKSDILLVQNPPAIPSLITCWIYARIVRAKLVIDWHNYAYTIMALSVGEKSALVKVTLKMEEIFGKLADANLCVTNAMRSNLMNNWNIKAVTLYDRPASMFHAISLSEKHEFLRTLSKRYPILGSSDGGTAFTSDKNGDIELRDDRPGLLVSSTSWTEDEDFSVLFSALQEYENKCNGPNGKKLPKLICVITGKGHMKQYYCSKIEKQNWRNVQVITPWLEENEYPLLLASADLGVSLHTSSSGLDLPMKVIDMFGCELPVCAYNFNCLHELVRHGENSYTFSTSDELSQQILTWFDNFPNSSRQAEIVEKFKAELRSFNSVRWSDNWTNAASSVFR